MTTVAIIGAGAIGLGTAAYLSSSGHEVRLFLRSAPPSLAPRVLKAEGALEWRGKIEAGCRLDQLVTASEVVCICVPGNAQKTVIDEIVPYLR
jgi:opine dehydrogenase